MMKISFIMKNIIAATLLSLIFYSCTESTNPLNPIPDTSPIWPMPGYNARNTSSPYAPDAVMKPVTNGTLGWMYTFPSGSYSDGSEFCVDSRGFIYYIHQIHPLGALYKFSPDGEVVWKKDSLIQWNYAGISLNRDETQIYFVAFKPGTGDRLYCLDSSGTEKWFISNAEVCIPAVGKDGTLYTFLQNGLSAISPNGGILWTNTSLKGMYYSKIMIDRDDNIYTFVQNSDLVKTDKSGTVVWQKNYSFPSAGIVMDGFGNIYFVGYSDYKLYCLNQLGETRWTKSGANGYSSPVITSKNDIIASIGSNVISFDTSGAENWRCHPFNNLLGAEGLLLDDADNVYYIGDGSPSPILAGSISSLGSKKWDVPTNLFVSLPPPVLLPQGRMVVAPKRAGGIQSVN